MKEYQHPPTFQATGDLTADFQYAVEDYDLNLAPLLPSNLDSRVMDVGCGWGQSLWWMRARGYRSLEGIDLGEEQVQFCRGLGLTAEQVKDSAEYLRARPDQYDLITMHHIIEHLDAPDGVELLRAAYSALRPEGRVIVQTPNMNATSANFTRHIELTHVTGFTDWSLDEALRVAGFVNTRVYGNQTPFRWTPRRLTWLALQRASRFLWRAMLIAELGSGAPTVLTKNIYGVGDRS